MADDKNSNTCLHVASLKGHTAVIEENDHGRARSTSATNFSKSCYLYVEAVSILLQHYKRNR